MDLFDVLWEASQEHRIREVREEMDRMQVERDLQGWDARQLAAENAELKMRLALLVRLLIRKGVVTAEEYASQIAEARPKG